MRECFSLFLAFRKDPQTKEYRIKYYWKIKSSTYFDGTPIWKMIIKDTLWDIKRLAPTKTDKQ